jgi:hypothetical protein
VLINMAVHDVVMLGWIVIAFIVALVPLAYLAGADSRFDEVARRRRYHG